MLLTDEDKLRIAKSLGLWRPGLFKIKTDEEWEQEQITLKGWHEVTLHGSDLPKRWRKDYANYTVVVIGWELSDDSLAPDWYDPGGGVVFSRFHDPLQIPTSVKPLLLCGARIYYKHSTAFAEMLIRGQRPTDPVIDDEWDEDGNVTHQTVVFNSIDSIQNTQECANESEIAKVWRGFNLCKRLLAMRGRPKGAKSKKPRAVIPDPSRRLTINTVLLAAKEKRNKKRHISFATLGKAVGKPKSTVYDVVKRARLTIDKLKNPS